MQPILNFDERPFIVIWETTQACDLSCLHCRACAQPLRHPLELNTAEAKRLIGEVAELKAPVFVLTGGDPLKRDDIFELVDYAMQRGVRISLTPSATPLLTRDKIAELKRRGLARLAISLDGPTAAIHDAFRRVNGSYDWTLNAVRWAHELGLPAQINTTITRHNLAHLDSMIALMETLDIVLWSVFFLVPTGRGSAADLISAEEFEQVFAKLYQTAQHAKFDICSVGALPTALVAPPGASMTARGSFLFPTSARFFPAGFCPFPPAISANIPLPTCIAIRRCSPACAIAPT